MCTRGGWTATAEGKIDEAEFELYSDVVDNYYEFIDEQVGALLEDIDAIVARLEDDTIPLDTAIGDFENGMALTRKAQALLEAAEQRVQVLLEDDSDDPAENGDEPAAD